MIPDELRRFAAHESGHAAAVLYHSMPLAWAIVDSDGGRVHYGIPRDDREGKNLFVVLAGREAEETMCGVSENAAYNHQPDREMAQAEAMRLGRGNPAAAASIMGATRQRVHQFVCRNVDLIAAVAQPLSERGRLEGHEIEGIVQGVLDATSGCQLPDGSPLHPAGVYLGRDRP